MSELLHSVLTDASSRDQASLEKLALSSAEAFAPWRSDSVNL